MRAAALALLILVAPAFAKTPLPQMKPCVAIDEAAITSVIRIVKLVAKSDYLPTAAGKRKIQDRLQSEPASKGSER